MLFHQFLFCFFWGPLRVEFLAGAELLSGKKISFCLFCFQAVFDQSQGQEWGRGGGSVVGQRGMRKGGGDKRHASCPLPPSSFQIPTGLVVRGGRRQCTCQPALHMSQRSIVSWSKGLLHTWHWVSSGGRLSLGLGVGGMGAGGAEASCLRKWDWTE